MINLIVFFIIAVGIIMVIISTIKRLISDKSVFMKVLGFGLLTIVMFTLIRTFLMSTYPIYDQSYIVCKVDKWIKMENLGWVYIKEIDGIGDNQLMMFYRRPGLNDNEIYDLDIALTDNNSNLYERGGGGIHGALIFSSGVLEFRGDSEYINFGDEFEIHISGQNYSLY